MADGPDEGRALDGGQSRRPLNARANAWLVVGVDCAVDPRNVGVCRARLSPHGLEILDVRSGLGAGAIAEAVCQWQRDDPLALVALDAPLGWPEGLARELEDHRAGHPFRREANALFRRATDDHVARALGKRPLDVAADRIARTAHAALRVLQALREATGSALPLPLTPGLAAAPLALEVYPAGTLQARGLPASGYKGTERREARARLLAALCAENAEPRESPLAVPEELRPALAESDHLLDAMLCTLAAWDFAQGNVMPPQDAALAEREGWIWVRGPKAPAAASHSSPR